MRSRSYQDIKYSWKSIQSFYSMFLAICILMFCSSCMVVLFKFGFDFEVFVDWLFYLSNFLSLVCFYELGRHWKNLLQHFNRVEARTPLFKTSSNKKRPLSREIKIISSLILVGSISERLFDFISVLISLFYSFSS